MTVLKQCYCALPYLIALLGLIACVIAYYPGILEPDSLDQLAQMQTGQLDDWHPAIMALIWGGLNHIHYGPQPLFLLHLGLFWFALALISRTLMTLGVRWAALGPLLGFAPWLFPLLGVIISDTALASAWLFSSALVFNQIATGKAANTAVLAVAFVAFGYGALVRANTLIAAAPLIYYASAACIPKRPLANLAVAALSPFLILAASTALNAATTTQAYPMGSLQVFDIGGVSHRVGQNLFPGSWSNAQAQTLVQCYEPDAWDAYGTPACGSAVDNLNAANLWNASSLGPAWRSAIGRHPGAYLLHRLDYANQFFRWLGPIPPGDIDYDTEPDAPAAFAHGGNPLYDFYSGLAEVDYVALRPYFWLAACLSVLLLSVLANPSGPQRFATALSASGAVYLLFYIVVGVASDFRYALWSICAVLAALGVLFACRWRPLRFGAGAIACSALIAVAIGVSALSEVGHPPG